MADTDDQGSGQKLKAKHLTPGELEKGRKYFLIFLIFNFIAFPFLSGNIITLIGLKLSVGNTLIGILSSAAYISFLFLLIGKILIRKRGAVHLLSTYYTARNLLMVPVLFLPFLEQSGYHILSIIVLSVSVFAFNVCRGIQLTSDNPIVTELGGNKEQGGFFSRLLLVSYAIAGITGIFMAYILKGDPGLTRYIVIIAVGLGSGLIGSRFIRGIPEPKESATGIREKLLNSFTASIKEKNFRLYYTILLLGFFTTSMITPFLIVYFKELYAVSDSRILVFNIFGNAGALIMALISSYSVDKLGAKPLMFTFTTITMTILVPVIIAPSLSGSAWMFIFPAAVFFFHIMGTTGMYSAGRIYFFSIIHPKQRLNLGILYFMLIGTGGALGSLLGGTLLDILLQSSRLSRTGAFRTYFILLFGLLLVVIILIRKLKDTAPYSIPDAITFILSPKDFRALTLLRKLERSKTIGEEKNTIKALKNTPSVLSVDQLLEKLNSPSLSIRGNALLALKNIPLTDQVEKVLISELRNHPFTTAYLAAELLGEKKAVKSSAALTETLTSEDYFLAAKSMVALAQIGDIQGMNNISGILKTTRNPRLIIHAAKAFDIFGEPQYLPVLLRKLKQKIFPFIRDEIILAIAGILGFYDRFYTLYLAFLEKGYNGVSLLTDYLDNHGAALSPAVRREFREMCEGVMSNADVFRNQVTNLLAEYPVVIKGEDISSAFREAVSDPDVCKLERFRFLTASILVYGICRK